MKYVTLQQIEEVACELAKEFMRFDEPIPDFGTRFPHKLESCLAAPKQTFGGRYLYPTLNKKAAILFYLMVKNHPFQNGNKRIAVMTLLYFLFKNKKWLRVSNQELYNFAKWVAQSNPRLKASTLLAIEEFLKLYIIDRNF